MRKASKTNTLARRHHIMRAALACFQRNGFHQASMADICAEAQMSRGHVYHYFDSKEALVEAVVDENLQDIQRALKDGTINADLAAQESILSYMLPDPKEADSALFSMDTALALEIVVEATRNKRLRTLLHKAMGRSNKVIEGLVNGAAKGGQLDPAVDPEALLVLLKLISSGWNVLSMSDPDFDPERTKALLRKLLSPLIDASGKPAPKKRRGGEPKI